MTFNLKAGVSQKKWNACKSFHVLYSNLCYARCPNFKGT